MSRVFRRFLVTASRANLRRQAARQQGRIEELEYQLDDKDKRIRELEQTVKVQEHHIELLSTVVGRETARVKAEMALIARRHAGPTDTAE